MLSAENNSKLKTSWSYSQRIKDSSFDALGQDFSFITQIFQTHIVQERLFIFFRWILSLLRLSSNVMTTVGRFVIKISAFYGAKADGAGTNVWTYSFVNSSRSDQVQFPARNQRSLPVVDRHDS